MYCNGHHLRFLNMKNLKTGNIPVNSLKWIRNIQRLCVTIYSVVIMLYLDNNKKYKHLKDNLIIIYIVIVEFPINNTHQLCKWSNNDHTNTVTQSQRNTTLYNHAKFLIWKKITNAKDTEHLGCQGVNPCQWA